MLQITKLSSISQNFIASLALNNKSRTIAVSIALSRVLSDRFSMPSVPVENVVLYFKTQNQLELDSMVSQLNELVALDISTVINYTIKFYQYRYHSVYPTFNIIALNKETAIVDFFNISKYFDKGAIEVIQDGPLYITEVANKFRDVLSELKG